MLSAPNAVGPYSFFLIRKKQAYSRKKKCGKSGLHTQFFDRMNSCHNRDLGFWRPRVAFVKRSRERVELLAILTTHGPCLEPLGPLGLRHLGPWAAVGRVFFPGSLGQE